ncbi:ead/Ea22-like family protein [Escherichia coli]|nr:ead/Ea22-like family protein [Escherichia coli]
MSNIDKQGLREAAENAKIAGEAPVMPFDQRIMALNDFMMQCTPAAVMALLDELEAKDKRIAVLESDNAYIRNRHKELDLLIGKNILVMQAAIIEWQGTGDARKGLAWIYNTLFGPGELPDESEKDAQAYFDRKYAPLDEELMNLHRWFWEQSEAERAAAAGKGEAS